MKQPQQQTTRVDEQDAHALSLLQQGSYKEAISAYKTLLKTENRPEWQEQLAQAYLQRALGLAQKGLYAEAVILWENYAALSQTPLHGAAFAVWLLRTSNYPKLSGWLKRYPQWLDSAQSESYLPEILGILLLGNDKLAAQLPQGCVLLKHYPLAKQALLAYCAQDDVQADACLRRIPVRSPYRDLRTLLKALLLLETERAAALLTLEKIPTASPYRAMVDFIGAQDTSDRRFVERYVALDADRQLFCQKFNGFDKPQQTLLKDIQKLSKHYSDRLAFETVLDERNRLGVERSRQLCLRLLPYYPAGIKNYEKTFGKLSRYENERRLALQEQLKPRDADIYAANVHWLNCVDELEKNPDQGDNALTAALILRHVASTEIHEDPDAASDFLINSLALDADDKPSYFQLLKQLDNTERFDEYKEWLERAQQQYPQDVDILMLAMKAAAKKKAFKKAAGYAEAVLAVDAINIHAKRMLIQCHIAHARKLIGTGKYALADKELARAQQLEQNRRGGIVQIVQALSAFKQGETAQAVALLQDGVRGVGGVFNGYFCVSVEALALKLSPHKVLKLLPKQDKAGKQDVLDVIKRIEQYSGEEIKTLPDALLSFDKPLRSALKMHDFSRDEQREICRQLSQIGAYSLLEYCAKQWSSRAHPDPLLTYYQIYARCKGKPDNVQWRDEQQLQMSMQDAAETGDHRAMVLIRAFLEKLYKMDEMDQINDMDDFFDQLDDLDIPPDEMLKKLFGAANFGAANEEEIQSMMKELEKQLGAPPGDLNNPVNPFGAGNSRGKPSKR